MSFRYRLIVNEKLLQFAVFACSHGMVDGPFRFVHGAAQIGHRMDDLFVPLAWGVIGHKQSVLYREAVGHVGLHMAAAQFGLVNHLCVATVSVIDP